MTKWLTIVGMGEDGWEGLSAAARQSILNARHVVGSQRLLSLVPEFSGAKVEWPQPFSAVFQRIEPFRGEPTVVLATGDPMNYGVARKLMETIPFSDITVIPHLSAFSLAAARMGWSLPDCDTLTLHGRETAHIEPFIQPDARLIVLTADATTVADVARRLSVRGFGDSLITVLENMGGTRERITSCRASDPTHEQYSDLNTLAIHCLATPAARIYSRLAGLPDEAFQHDGQLTKREVRAVTLAALCPGPDQLLWDIGAGCGSVAIEWMRAARGCRAIAFEHDAARLAMISTNADALGTPRLKVIAGTAPACLHGQPEPNAIFVGGGLTEPGLFETAWAALKPGGMLVANAVTLEGESCVYALQATHGGDIARIEVSHLTPVGDLRALRPRMAVTQWRVRKPW